MSYLKSATVFDRKVMLVLRWCCRNVNDHEPRENNSKNKKKVMFSVGIYIYHPCVFMESKRERKRERDFAFGPLPIISHMIGLKRITWFFLVPIYGA